MLLYCLRTFCNTKSVQTNLRMVLKIILSVFAIICITNADEKTFYVSVKDDVNNLENYGQSFLTNTASNVVALDFQTPSMLTVTEISAFSQDIRLWRIIVPGEIARGEPPFQTLCFLSRLGDTNLLRADAISKLRQKKPKLIRLGEEERPDDHIVSTLSIPLSVIPKPIKSLAQSICSSSPNGIYINEEDFRTLFDEGFNGNVLHLSTLTLPRCNTVTDSKKPCQCELKVKIAWYPCGWHYCSNDAQVTPGQPCGIKSCRVKRIFYYEVGKKIQCGWDK